MKQSSGAWARVLTVAIALVVGLFAVSAPVSAATSTKKYSAVLSGGVKGGQELSVPTKATGNNTVTLVLTNQQDSQQAFGSAQLDFVGPPLPGFIVPPTPSGLLPVQVSRTGWTVQEVVKGTRYRLVNSGTLNPVPPGTSLSVTITLPGTPGTTELRTQVRQSNDFRGTNNDFTLTSSPEQPLKIFTVGSCGGGTCTEPTFISTENKIRADLTLSASAPFTFTAGFTTAGLSCDKIPFGDKVPIEPFQVATDRSTEVSKTLVLTFPKALANLVPNNGTALHPVCAGADVRFPGSDPVGVQPNFEGLLLNCNDPVYVDQVRAFNTGVDPHPLLPMCVSARARNAGNLIITITVEPTLFDPRFW